MGNDQKRAFLAIVLSGIVLFGWQFYFAPKKDIIPTTTPIKKIETVVADKTIHKPQQAPKATPTKSTTTYRLRSNSVSYNIDSRMSLLGATNVAAKFSFEETLGNKNPIRFYILKNGTKSEINLAKVSESENSFAGSDAFNGVDAKFTLQENGFLNVNIVATTPSLFAFELTPQMKTKDAKSVRQFAVFGKEVDRFDMDDDELAEKPLSWFSLDYNYHLVGVTFPSKTLLSYGIGEAMNGIEVKTLKPEQQFSFNYIFTDKNYDKLVAFGNKLELSVDYGVFGILAVPILKTLQFIHKYIPNYGIAIIILTLILRLLLYPLQVKSFKSMKKMQQVQPEVKLLKEKYKDDPKRQQQETMALFKRAGANPLGGCLPLLLQMPFFFAIFQVLRNSIELVNAPFFGWITDLSAKDPYYVLPVLMCLAMIVQQKVTPSPSADPAQKKMMMIMPLVFGFIMKDLPSGLCLYIFISTLFGFAQQMIVYRFTN